MSGENARSYLVFAVIGKHKLTVVRNWIIKYSIF